jgi:hypothetical protein
MFRLNVLFLLHNIILISSTYYIPNQNLSPPVQEKTSRQNMPVEKQNAQAEHATQTLEDLKQTLTIDTIHQDEALRVFAQYAGEEI